MNILVANISVLHKGDSYKYRVVGLDCAVSEIEARETNESILKCVVNLNSVRETGGLGKVIALVSNDVLNKRQDYLQTQTTAFEYFLKCASELGISKEDIIEVHIENDNSPRDINLILDDICKNISADDTVYIDGAGGLRTINNIIQLLTKILKYTGIKNPHTLYADVQNKQNCFISDTKNFDKMTDLADAFNEFMTSGKSEQLRQCIKNTPNENVLNLVNMMCEFSDKIRLSNIDNIEATVNSLKDAASKVENENDSSCIESVIIRRFIPVIREKFIGENQKTDYCRLVNWCLENSLVQQAVTIFTEKIPVYLFDNNILVLNNPNLFANYEDEKKENKNLPVHWQTRAVYAHILSEPVQQNPLYVEFMQYEERGKKLRSPKVKNLISMIDSLEFPVTGNSNALEKYCKDSQFKEKKSLINTLMNKNQKKFLELLGEPVNDKESQDKFSAVNYIVRTHKFGTSDFSYNVPLQRIVDILYGYLYVKNIRNRINHASDAEMFTESQKAALKDYDFLQFDMETVRKNIFKALKPIMGNNVKANDTEGNNVNANDTEENNVEAIDTDENNVEANDTEENNVNAIDAEENNANAINTEGFVPSEVKVISVPGTEIKVKVFGKIDISKYKNKKKKK